MMIRSVLGVVALTLGLLVHHLSHACSNLLVSPQASADGSTLLTYSADSGTFFGVTYHYPAADNPVGTMRKVYDWDSGAFHGEIPEVEHTHTVNGNMNEYGLAITETTFGGLTILQSQPGAIIDYGSMIYITLMRAKNAREAIAVIASLMSEYGWASGGESFSIADGKEVWIMEIIGKGQYELGGVYVARLLPPGAICAHANQARITTFPLSDPDTCIYSPDVISFARKIGLYGQDEKDEAFSFSDVYDPVSFGGARFCEARVWTLFGQVMGQEFMNTYLDYAMGYNLTNRMPLFVFPPADTKISEIDAMTMMRTHFEGTELDMSGTSFADVGAINAYVPYRAHPLTWVASNGKTYLNERPVATQQAGWSIVAQTRSWLPPALSGLLWFGADESSTTCHTPIYSSATSVPSAYAGQGPQDGVVMPVMTFDPTRAFFAFNLVANWAYSRWSSIYPDVLAQITQREAAFVTQVAETDALALQALNEPEGGGLGPMLEVITKFGVSTGEALVKDWNALFGTLFVKYRDGYVFTQNNEQLACGCNAGTLPYPTAWYDQIVSSTADHYLVPSATYSAAKFKFAAVDKLELLKRL